MARSVVKTVGSLVTPEQVRRAAAEHVGLLPEQAIARCCLSYRGSSAHALCICASVLASVLSSSLQVHSDKLEALTVAKTVALLRQLNQLTVHTAVSGAVAVHIARLARLRNRLAAGCRRHLLWRVRQMLLAHASPCAYLWQASCMWVAK